ncbi:hypothetical protein [Lentilactobacillus parakefiri]|uniref:Uncharacterized protein n=1 Tax=Lentilactobacillus parakefiri TaxID=152332 RepID=A0A224V2K1_9LACO|nr:hypothetical protein [Lentilactobacillus parakefiri]KRL71998.1 hypothetical protein FD08_GL004629 [Lentilactobacillus parakefiri DSM 10551]TDG93427.1 hypothetical protein C5L28_000338 [Lentilactobacillus parakefiri]GAW71067.1 hypothetical protein LPKJCM_00138 [Lentilactobacillus parakefiri]
MANLIILAANLVPKESFPLDKTLASHSIIGNLITSIIIIAFIALIAWIVYEAFDEKKE